MASQQRRAHGAGLVAVLLITRSRTGPRLVFQYPVAASPKPHRVESDDSEIDSGDEEVGTAPNNRSNGNGIPDVSRLHLNDGGTTPTELILGHSIESMEKLLSPGRWCDRKKFEVGLDGITFVGHPIYAPEDGNWSGKPREPHQHRPSTPTPAPTRYGDYHMYLEPGSLAPTPPDSLIRPSASVRHDFTHVPESLESHPRRSFGASMESDSTASMLAGEQMTMFHIVFALQSQPQWEAKVIYDEVAKKLSKALHYCQKQSDYVSIEARRLGAIKTRAKISQASSTDVQTQMVETSELAWALKEVYKRISTGEVASINLNGMELSLHMSSPKDAANNEQPLEPLSALLLLESKESLLHQLAHPDASPLAHFIREHTPTKNLQKHATNLGFPISDILYLSQHLIQWRKARTITPLHQRNTYVVSPTAPLDPTTLSSLTSAYHRAFPTLPSLPNMLKVLSGKPIKYGLLIPSRDHRGAYMDILAFLMRARLVEQLKTYGWLKLPPNLPTAVTAPYLDPNRRPLSVRSLLSPRMRPVGDDDAESVASERTAIPVSAKHSRRLSSGPAQAEQEEAREPLVLIKNPRNPSPAEARLLGLLRESLSSEEFREKFDELVGSMDGKAAFEEIAARLGVKRARVEEWIAELERRGFLEVGRWI